MTVVIDSGILCGGLSRRMKGQEKGLTHFRGQAMVTCIAQALCSSTNQLRVNCNQEQSAYQDLGFETCSDAIAGHKGPLAGIHSLLAHSVADYMLLAPCDTPLLSSDYAQKMLAAVDESRQNKPNMPLIFAAESKGKLHPLHICIARSLLTDIEVYLASGERRVMAWLNAHQVQHVTFTDHAQFQNVNSLDELRQLNLDHPL